MTHSQPPTAKIDWKQLTGTLERFALTTGMCVSAYDTDAVRRAGPFCPSRVGALLERSGIWSADGAGTALDADLARRTREKKAAQSHRVDEELEVVALPVLAEGVVVAVVILGWVFTSFTTPLACRRLATTLGVDATKLWAEARLESPTPHTRINVALELLGTLLDLMDQHAQSIAKLDRLASLREAFLAYVSHELRTPLQALRLRIQVLLRSPLQDAAQMRSQLTSMVRHVEDESRLVEDLIDAARTRTGQLTLTKVVAPMIEWVRQAVESVKPVAQEKNVLLHEVPERELLGLSMLGDSGRLQQMLWNLLVNAVKFTPAGGTVRLTAHADAESVYLAVADTGTGIDAALLPFIFDPFTRQHRANSKGLGLGLSIAKEIAEKHGGSIAVRSAGPGAGSTFTISLPRHTP